MKSICKFLKKDFYTQEKLNINIVIKGNFITIDNWFYNVPLIQSLLQDEQLTVIGTIKKNKRNSK